MNNFCLIWIFSTILCLFFYIGCVGPPEPDHWMEENRPGVTNSESFFSFQINSKNFSFNDHYTLDMNFDSTTSLTIKLIVSEYSNSNNKDDTIRVFNWNGEEKLYDYNNDGDSTDVLFEFEDSNLNYSWDMDIDSPLYDYNNNGDSTDVLFEFEDSFQNGVYDQGNGPRDILDSPFMIEKIETFEHSRQIDPYDYYPEIIDISLSNFTGVIELFIYKH